MDAVFKTEFAVFNYRVAGVWLQDGHVLLHKNMNDSHWALPGGRVKLMEESTAGLLREFQEELNVELKVERLMWTTENFFHYDGKDFHEIAFYYEVTSIDAVELKVGAFHGAEEDKPLIYEWVPLTKLGEMSIQPSFLKDGLQELPLYPEHVVIRD